MTNESDQNVSAERADVRSTAGLDAPHVVDHGIAAWKTDNIEAVYGPGTWKDDPRGKMYYANDGIRVLCASNDRSLPPLPQ